MQVLKVEVPDMWLKPVVPQGETLGFGVLPIVGCYTMGLWQDCVLADPTHFERSFSRLPNV